MQTSEGVKAADVAWASHERRKSKPNDPLFLIAPEICVEVESPSNSHEEFMERKRLYFEQGAEEFWVCGLLGDLTFYDQTGEIPASKRCPAFPKKIELD
jgi:Uma2 family endonuclease